MKSFEYGDEKINDRELMIAVPSYVIGPIILTLPRDLAAATTSSDGWISLLAGGLVSIIVMWLIAKLVVGFPNQYFSTYTSTILTRPVAIVVSLLFAVLWINVTAFEVRKIADMAKLYLFERTPVEIIALTFLLVVVYAVSGSRAGLFRLNVLFLPIILFIAVVVFVLNLGLFDVNQLLPLFETDIRGYLQGMHVGMFSYVGFVIVLFYIGLVDNPKRTPKMAAIGMCIPIVLYMLLFILSIGVFGNSVTANLLYPTVELAKNVEIPGGFFERFDILFFIIWIMAIFNTTSMALDIVVISLNSIFKHTEKIKIVCILAPIVYSISMLPQNILEVKSFGSTLFNTTLIYSLFIPLVLFVVAKLRGIKRGK